MDATGPGDRAISSLVTLDLPAASGPDIMTMDLISCAWGVFGYTQNNGLDFGYKINLKVLLREPLLRALFGPDRKGLDLDGGVRQFTVTAWGYMSLPRLMFHAPISLFVHANC
jgi:hypothetical protein